jgi:MFS family permease
MMGAGVPLSAWLINRFDGKKVYLYSLAGFTVTMFLAVFSPEIAVLLVRGAGLGMLSVPVMVCIYDGLDTKDAAQGTVSSRMFMQIGSALGTAVLAIVLSHVLANAETPFSAFNTVYWWAVGITVLCAVPAALLTGKSGIT